MKKIVFYLIVVCQVCFFSCAKDTTATGKSVSKDDTTPSAIVLNNSKSSTVSDNYNNPLNVTAEKMLSDIFNIEDAVLSDNILFSKLGSKPDKIETAEVENLFEKGQKDKMITYFFPGRTVKIYENTKTKERYLLGLHITKNGNSLQYSIDIGYPKEKFIDLFGFDKQNYATVDSLGMIPNEGGGSIGFRFMSGSLIEIDFIASM